MTRHELRRHLFSTLHQLAVHSQPSQYHQHSYPCSSLLFFFLLLPRVHSVLLLSSTLRLFPSPHPCIITSNFSHSYGFALSFRPRLLLCPRLPLHEDHVLDFSPPRCSHLNFFFFSLSLTARVLHGFGVLADVLLPLTPPSSVMNHMRLHFFPVRHWALSVYRWPVIRS